MSMSFITSETINVKHATLRQQVAEILRSEILRGKYLPGDRIVEAEIAEKLEISRGPVREAIRQLEEEGLVTYSNNKGCSVTTLDPMDAWEIYLLRAELESLAITLCKGDVGTKALMEMEASIKKMAQAAELGDIAEMVAQDHNFHSAICKACNRKRLYKLWSSLNSTSYAIFLTVISANVRPVGDIAPLHTEVLEALATHNEELACQVIRNHYLSTGKELIRKRNGNSLSEL